MTRFLRQHTLLCPLATAVLLAGAATTSLAQDGVYIVEPWIGRYSDVKIQPNDQKIVVAGTVQSQPHDSVALARYDSAGNLDASFGSGGLSIVQGVGFDAGALALQSDGKAVVATSLYSGSYFYIGAGRFNNNGAIDSTFGNGGWSGVNVGVNFASDTTAIGLTSTGKIVVGGFRTPFPGSNFSRTAVLAGFTAKGALDSGKGGFGDVSKGGQTTGSTFATFGGYAGFTSLVVQPDNKVVAVGDFSMQGAGAGQLIVARYTAGVLDTTFNATGLSILNLPGLTYTTVLNSRNDVALQSDGKIVAASSASGSDGSSGTLVVRYAVGGAMDTTFGGGNGYVRLATGTLYGGQDLVMQPDGKIVVVSSLSAGQVNPATVAVTRLNPNGTLDPTFGSGGLKLAPAGPFFQVEGVALQSDGHIIVAGYEGSSETPYHPALMRFNP